MTWQFTNRNSGNSTADFKYGRPPCNRKNRGFTHTIIKQFFSSPQHFLNLCNIKINALLVRMGGEWKWLRIMFNGRFWCSWQRTFGFCSQYVVYLIHCKRYLLHCFLPNSLTLLLWLLYFY